MAHGPHTHSFRRHSRTSHPPSWRVIHIDLETSASSPSSFLVSFPHATCLLVRTRHLQFVPSRLCISFHRSIRITSTSHPHHQGSWSSLGWQVAMWLTWWAREGYVRKYVTKRRPRRSLVRVPRTVSRAHRAPPRRARRRKRRGNARERRGSARVERAAEKSGGRRAEPSQRDVGKHRTERHLPRDTGST